MTQYKYWNPYMNTAIHYEDCGDYVNRWGGWKLGIFSNQPATGTSLPYDGLPSPSSLQVTTSPKIPRLP